MSNVACECGYLGKGKFFIDELNNPQGRRFFGAIKAATIEADVEAIEEVDPTTPGGGKCISKKRYSALRLSMVGLDACADNLGIMTLGNVYADHDGATPTPTVLTDGANITDEPHDAWRGRYVMFDHLLDVNQPVVIKDTATPTPATIPAAQYDVVNGGVFIHDNAAAFTAGTKKAITATYKTIAGNVIEAATHTGKDYVLDFIGENEAVDNLGLTRGFFHRASFSPGALALLQTGTEVAQLPFEAELLTKTGATAGTQLSRFYRLIQQPFHA